MNSADVLSLIEDLEDGIEELEEDLEPILNDSLSTTTKKLPLLEKAKLYTLIVYAIESLLFCKSTSHLSETVSDIASLPSSSWRCCERAPSLQRAYTSTPVLRQDQASRKRSTETSREHEFEQGGCGKIHQSCTGTTISLAQRSADSLGWQQQDRSGVAREAGTRSPASEDETETAREEEQRCF